MPEALVMGGLFGTAEMRELFSDRHRVARMAEVEAALARAEAGLGIVPAAAAAAIDEAARTASLDLEAIARSAAVVGYPVIGLTKALAVAAGPEAGRWVHWGATTQDILDTAVMLQVRDGLRLLERDLVRAVRGFAALAARHRDSPMAGRTHLQHALPITFGYKVAVWMQPLLRLVEQFRMAPSRLCTLQFAGAVGTLAALGRDGGAVHAALAAELDLPASPTPWHVDRLRLAEVVSLLGLLGGALGKIATDVILLMQTEVAEVSEPHQSGRGGSSTMPQKRNPIASEYIIAAARGVQAVVPIMLAAMAQDHERATGPWQSEDLALPQAFILSAGALMHTCSLAEGLVVDTARMRANLDATRGLIMAEAAMMGLAGRMGRDAAHHAVQQACDKAIAGGKSLSEALGAEPEIAALMSPAEIASLLDPASYLGRAGEIVDAVVTAANGICDSTGGVG